MEKVTDDKSLRFLLPVLAWMGIIFFFSSRQRVSVSGEYVLNFLFFKTLHLIEYGTLFLLTARFIGHVRPKKGLRDVYLWSLVVSIVYAATDELHQQFVPTREGTVRDVIIDGIGATLVWYLLSTWLPRMPRKLRNWARTWDVPF